MKIYRFHSLLLAASFALVSCSPAPAPQPSGDKQTDDAYRAEVEAWRAERDEDMRSPNGWLTLAGLYWLEEGDSTFGSAPDNTVVFPAGKAPEKLGTFHRQGEKVTLDAVPGTGLQADGKEVTAPLELAPDTSGKATMLSVGSLTFHVINRPGKVGIRLKDRESAVLAGFTGVESFPIDPVVAHRGALRALRPAEEDQGAQHHRHRLRRDLARRPGLRARRRNATGWSPRGEAGKELFLVFGDATNGHETYGGGRFLYVPPPVDGKAIVDFNKAYNPPCVFTPYATCPLPPRQNKLAGLRIEAGDKMWGEAH